MNPACDEDKLGYVLSRADRNVRALLQTSCLKDEYSTAQDMLQPLANAYNDPHRKAKVHALYRDLHLREQLGLLFCELEAEKCDGLAIKLKGIAREINLDSLRQ